VVVTGVTCTDVCGVRGRFIEYSLGTSAVLAYDPSCPHTALPFWSSDASKFSYRKFRIF
jgi:hypothetical protein